MLKWLMGRGAPAARATQKQAAAPSRRVVRPAGGPALPQAGAADSVLPEVVAEGNTQADWSAWEDSMTVWDSQMQDLPPSQRVQVRQSRPSRPEEIDPFATVASRRVR
ncbi:MAG TPA: hypothetical protein VGC80_04875 [Acetobacteraceae bacterium]